MHTNDTMVKGQFCTTTPCIIDECVQESGFGAIYSPHFSLMVMMVVQIIALTEFPNMMEPLDLPACHFSVVVVDDDAENMWMGWHIV